MTKFVPKIMVIMCCQSCVDGMKMNKRILLSPVLEVANEKPAFFGEEHDVD
jgi:hypothetical protein